MRVDSRSLWDTLYLVVLAAGIAVSALHVSLGQYHLAFIAAIAAGVGLGIVAVEQVPAVARMALPGLAALRQVFAPGIPVRVRVAGAQGACAWGYRVGQSWAIDDAGHIRPPLCLAAAAALAPLLAQPEDRERQVACRCPLVHRQVVFAMGAQAA